MKIVAGEDFAVAIHVTLDPGAGETQTCGASVGVQDEIVAGANAAIEIDVEELRPESQIAEGRIVQAGFTCAIFERAARQAAVERAGLVEEIGDMNVQ